MGITVVMRIGLKRVMPHGHKNMRDWYKKTYAKAVYYSVIRIRL
jgi:hypothetical protein